MIPSFQNLSSLPELWESLAREARDIWLYGMGNGADKILAVLGKRGIAVKGVFASDGFVRGQAFHGMPVRSFSEVKALYPPNGCVILLSFGSARPEVLATVEGVADHFPLFVPDVPVCGEVLFDKNFFLANEEKFAAARALLCDDTSRRIFDLILAYKLTGRYDLLMAATDEVTRESTLIPPKTVCRMADFGAYTGDTVRDMLDKGAPLHYICAVEPDCRNHRKLSDFAKGLTDCHIDVHRAAVSDTVGEAPFDASGNRNAGLATGRESAAEAVPTVTADALLRDRTIDYIKYDVEGAEAAALRGTAKTLTQQRPRLKIACYHRSEDLFALPLLLHALAPDYTLYLTRRRSAPAWDLDLLALPL
ncbi:MAG: FkbM family methyltransferase [Ruminococcaceae bacterium]|nr:FkbM family methyltransferase [Oscillospiraceae bacterium]